MSESRYSKRISEQTWEAHKRTILHLYRSEKKPLTTPGGVRDTMRLEHGFSATKSQYETRLKKWGCFKYAAAHDRRTKAPVPDNPMVDGLVTERHPRRSNNDIPAQAHSFSESIPIGTSSPQGFTIQPSSRSSLSSWISSPAFAEVQHNMSCFSTHSVNLQPATSCRDIELLLPKNSTRTSSVTIATNNPFDFAMNMDFNADTSSRIIYDMDLSGDTGGLRFSSNFMYTSSFSRQNDIRLSNPNSSMNDFSLRDTIQSSGLFVSDFATSIFPIISHMFPRAVSSPHLVRLANSSAFDCALEKVSHPRTLRLVRQQSINHQVIYTILHRLINDGDAVEALEEPQTELDQLFKIGVLYCFSLGKRVLRSLIDATPPLFNMALMHNIFRAALVLDNVTVLSDILEMNQKDLANRLLTFEGREYYPLEYAISRWNIQAIQALLDHGADLNPQTFGTKYLDMIIGMPLGTEDPRVGVQILRLLIAHGLKPSPERYVSRMRHCSWDELSLLASYCRGKSFETFVGHNGLPTILLRKEWDDSFSKTLEVILDQAFLEINGQQQLWNAVLSDSLSAAILNSHASAVEVLLSRGATPNTHCLISAAQSNNVRILKDFLSRGLDPNSAAAPPSRHIGPWDRNSDCTALSVSIMNRSKEAFQVLQEQGFVLRLSRQPAGFASVFLAACEAGVSALVEQLLSLPNFPRKEVKLQHAIEIAMEGDQYHIIEKLLSAGMKPNPKSLRLAIQKKHLPTVILVARYLYLADRSIFSEPLQQTNAITWETLRWGDQTALEHVVRAGHPINVCDELSFGEFQDWELLTEIQAYNPLMRCHHTPLGAAILGRNAPAVRTLMAYGTKAVLFNSHGTSHSNIYVSGTVHSPWIMTPLVAAAVAMDLPLMREILRVGADPFDNNALHVCAVVDSGEEVVALLLSAFRTRYPDGAQDFGSDALYQTIRSGNMRLFELLAGNVDLIAPVLEDDGSNEPRDSLPNVVFTSPLGEAVRQHAENKGTGKALEHLLPLVKDLNAVVHRTYKQGYMTSLLYAISLGSLATVQKLHQAGADISLPAEWLIRRTPLQAAAQFGRKDIVEYLIREGAIPDEPPAVNAGATALQLAAISGYIGIATILIDAGADINALPAVCDGRTAFEGATEHGRLEMMMFLVDHGADLLANNGAQYRRAVEYAEDNGQDAAKELAENLYAKALADQGTTFIDMGVDAWAGADMNIFENLLP